MQSNAATAAPTKTPLQTVGWALLRFGTAGWIGYGAIAKAIEFNPQLLPPPILKSLLWIATNTSVDANSFLEWSYRAILGAEIFIVLAILFSARWARPIAIATLAFFCIILLEAMRQTAVKEGFAKALTGSCGCFGEKGLPASVMLLVDSLLLASAIFLAPRVKSGGATAVFVALAVGAVAAVAIPAPTVAAPVRDGGDDPPTQPAVVDGGAPAAPSGPWPPAPERYEPFYFPKWKEWVGKPLRDQKLALVIERPVPDDLERGDWIVVFSRNDCETCQELYRAHFATPRAERVLKVVIPDSREKPLAMPCAECVEVLLYRVRAGQGAQLGKSPDYLVQTPVMLRLKDGIVTAVAPDYADKDAVHAVLGGGATAAPVAAVTPPAAPKPTWPALPATLKSFYIAEFGGAVGKPLADNEFVRLIGTRIPADFLEGRWLIVFYREDCEHCHELLATHFTGKLATRTMTIAIPDADPNNIEPNPCDECVKASLVKGPNYVIATPVVLAMKDGVVECVIENVDDLAALEACLRGGS